MLLVEAKSRLFAGVVSFILSIIFTLAFLYIITEIPYQIDKMLLKYFPDIFWKFETKKRFISSIRPFGYISFIILLCLVILGFQIKRSSITVSSSFLFFLPTFGYFSLQMFFLAGIGILRVIWLPIIDLDPRLLQLGDLFFLPLYMFFNFAMQYNFRIAFYLFDTVFYLSKTMMFLGLLFIFFGTFTWLYGKFVGYEIVNFWIYRYSRHPQYLGIIFWSYGLALMTTIKCCVYGNLLFGPSLIWVFTTMVIIGVALQEELDLLEKYGDKYRNYQRVTPFMFYIPNLLKRILLLPSRIVFKDFPKNRREIVVTLIIYTILIMILSYFLILIYFGEWE